MMLKFSLRHEKSALDRWETYIKTHNSHRFFDDMMHLASLLHATACMSLRWDVDFDNLVSFVLELFPKFAIAFA